jgi:hypothetical protein
MHLATRGVVTRDRRFVLPGADPTTTSYNASVAIFYNATNSLAHFENKNIFFYIEKRSSLLQRWRCSCKFKSRRIGCNDSPLVKPSGRLASFTPSNPEIGGCAKVRLFDVKCLEALNPWVRVRSGFAGPRISSPGGLSVMTGTSARSAG